MSAYICNPDHIKALAIYAANRNHTGIKVDPRYVRGLDKAPQVEAFDGALRGLHNLNNYELATLYANVMYAENIRSVSARYPNDSFDDLPGLVEKPRSIEITSRDFINPQYKLKSVSILKMCSCLEYQSCETDDWESTVAYRLIDSIRAAAIRSLPGYEDAPWEFHTQTA